MTQGKPRVNFIREQLDVFQSNPNMPPEQLVQNFRVHYPNAGSFASSLSRFKSILRKLGIVSNFFLNELKPTQQEMTSVRVQQSIKLKDKCKKSITLNNSGDNLIQYFRSCLEATDLGHLFMGIQACCGFRLVETVIDPGGCNSTKNISFKYRRLLLGPRVWSCQETKGVSRSRETITSSPRSSALCTKETPYFTFPAHYPNRR
jgi:hypothetical protein